MTTERKSFSRLPINVKPYHYEINLTPDLRNFTCQGWQNVEIEVIEATKIIVLNCLAIVISKVIYKNNNGVNLKTENIEFSADEETVTLTFPERLPVGKNGRLYFEFTSEINDKLTGFYRSKYTGAADDKEPAAVTFLCPTSARRVFPCWDEPNIKATFGLTLNLRNLPNAIGLSNMPVELTETNGNTRTMKFQTSPIMSTYLLAIVVGEFDYVENKTTDNTTVRVYAPKTKQEQGRFALDVATKALPYYNKYFGISYPLPKMDLIAIADFSAGAMENWGLVTYRENRLLVDLENTSTVSKQEIALTVSHEIAHQWFGNLVTMEWWTHLWLNEGYARFIEHLCVAHLFPEYDIWTQFVSDTYIKALELDGLKNSHPIEVPVGHPSEIDEIFDVISYNKGGSIIRMLYTFIGDEDFKKGMNIYLNRYAYKNAETNDLWKALEEASNKPITSVMSTWTKQVGFPVITVHERQDGKNRILTLSQERFLSDGSADPNHSLWAIPVSVSTSDSREIAFNTVMEEKTKEVVIKNVAAGSWIKLNPGTVGFYRTRYTSQTLDSLKSAVEDCTLQPADRLGLIDDLFAMVRAGHSSTVDLLKFMDAFQNEDNYTVWTRIVSSLGRIGVLLSNLKCEGGFKAFGKALCKNVAAKLGWEPKKGESHLDTLLRSVILNRMVAFGDNDTITEARRRFDLHVTGKRLLAADLRSAVYRAVLSQGDNDTFDSMVRLYRETDLIEEKERILSALGAVNSEEYLSKVLDLSLSSEMRSQDSLLAIVSVSSNSKGRQLAWDFFKTNSEAIVERFQGLFLLQRLVKGITENFSSLEKALEVEAFFKKNPAPSADRTVQQSIENIRLNAAWLERDQVAIEDYLKESGFSC